jgi:hypothetical protein
MGMLLMKVNTSNNFWKRLWMTDESEGKAEAINFQTNVVGEIKQYQRLYNHPMLMH